MTIQTVRSHPGTQALLGLVDRVFDVRFRLVARRAARGGHRAHRARLQLMAAIARQALLHHVRLMPSHTAIFAPLLLDDDALPRSASSPVSAARRWRRTGCQQRKHEHGQ